MEAGSKWRSMRLESERPVNAHPCIECPKIRDSALKYGAAVLPADTIGGGEALMQRMIGRIEAGAALAVLLLLATGGSLAAQEFAGREKLRAHSDEFRKDVIKVTDG